MIRMNAQIPILTAYVPVPLPASDITETHAQSLCLAKFCWGGWLSPLFLF